MTKQKRKLKSKDVACVFLAKKVLSISALLVMLLLVSCDRVGNSNKNPIEPDGNILGTWYYCWEDYHCSYYTFYLDGTFYELAETDLFQYVYEGIYEIKGDKIFVYWNGNVWDVDTLQLGRDKEGDYFYIVYHGDDVKEKYRRK